MPGSVPGAEQMDQWDKPSPLWNLHFNGGRESEQANRHIMQFQIMIQAIKGGGEQVAQIAVTCCVIC